MAERGTAGYQIFTLEDHARAKGMWAGALERTAIPGLSGVFLTDAPDGPRLELREIVREHTPAVLKIIDEGLVNASDHHKEHERGPAGHRVTRICLDFDPATGKVAIENDGPGIPVVVHAAATAEARAALPAGAAAEAREAVRVYVPEVAFARFLAGRNMEKPPDSVKGGINGIGGKLINVHSAEFAVETVGAGPEGAPTVYLQIFRDRLRVREAPVVFLARSARGRALPAARRAPHTRITFVPAYAELGYALEGGRLAPADAADLEAWCRWRMCLLAAYVGPKVAVAFNGEACPTTTAAALAELAVAGDPDAIVMACVARAPDPPCSAHPWAVAVAVVPSARRFGQLTVINGVHCAKGPHIRHVKQLLGQAVGARLRQATKADRGRKFTAAETCGQVFLVIVGALPGADWNAQGKSELQVPRARVAPYAIGAAALGRIAETVTDAILRGAEKGRRGRKRRVKADKYTRARLAGTKDAARCALLAAEGDSAITLLRAGLTLGAPGGPTFERYGIVSLGGVTMNAMRKVTTRTTAAGETILVRGEKLRNHKVFKTLVEVLGLDFTCRYETPAEVARLRYGSVVVCTDQDLDGTGKILPLVLVWFHVFWPGLIARGFVKRFMSPVIRAYPRGGGEALEFFYEEAFERWAAGLGDGGASRGYAVKYYKGLATHGEEEVARMFAPERFARSVYTFALDPAAAELFDVYFGPRAALRKAALATPVAYLSAEAAAEIQRARRIPCSVQLRVDAKAYKLDDLQRKLPSVVDGIPVARRKVLAGALRRFASSNREVKVFQLGGYIAEHMYYHHGDASLNGTIVKMAQRFPGALNFPYLSGVGQFGSRHFGGADAGSPRYVNVRLAAPYARAMLAAEDTWLLPHVFEDGERAQPRYFVPTLPAALLESFEIPSEGWTHKSFARDLAHVLALTRAYVSGDGLVPQVAAAAAAAAPGTALGALGLPAAVLADFLGRFPLGVSLRGYGEGLEPAERRDLVRPHKGYLHSFGWYRPEHRGAATVLRVSELPLGKTTAAFLKDLEQPARAKLIDEVDDYSSGAEVDVRIRLAPGAWDAITAAGSKYGDRAREVDPIEHFLLLRASLKPHLNFYGAEGGVLEFGDDYHALFFHWAPLRRDLYRRRLEREAAVLALKVRLELEAVRFIEAGLDLAQEADESAAGALLAQHAFARFDAGFLRAPRYAPAAQVARLATRGPGVGYAYLLDLRGKDLVASAKARRKARAAEMSRRLARVEQLLAERPFAGASVWAAEVEAAAAAIERGRKTRWRFG